LYRAFFGEVVGEFVHVLIAENVKLAVPALVILDPTDVVAGFVADQVVKMLPSPCAEAVKRGPDHTNRDATSSIGMGRLSRGMSPG
jgi:hypothetical protein